jgi:hypothetical protein
MKAHVITKSSFCDGEAYIFDSEDVDARGETYDRYRPCEMCHGSGNRAKWVGLRELSDLLERAIAMEPSGIAVGCSALSAIRSNLR